MTIDDAGKQTLHPSRPFTLIYVSLALMMSVVSVFLILVVAPAAGIKAMVAGWAGLLLFGLATVLFGVQCVWPTPFGLTLDKQGFTVRMNLGSRRYLWNEVEQFFLYETVAPYPVVVFKYRAKPEIHGLQWTRGFSRRFDGTLPQNLPVRGRRLLDLMETWRLRTTRTA